MVINEISQVPRTIANFVELANPTRSCIGTGHCFRSSSVSSLANSDGADLITVKKHGSWKSSSVAEGPIEACLKRKTEVADMLKPSTSTSTLFCDNVQLDVPVVIRS